MLDLSQMPDKPGKKLDLSALPDQSQTAQEPPQDTMLNRVASGINRVTEPIGRAVEAVVSPFVKTALDISQLPDKVDESAIPDIAKPVVKSLASTAVAPVKAGLMGMQAMGAGFEALEKGGEYIAEKGGELGVPPEIAAGVGTLVSKGPDIAATLTGGGQLLAQAGKAGAKTAAKKAFIESAEALKALPKQPALLHEGAETIKPVYKLEQLKAGTKQPTGEIEIGHRSAHIQKAYNDLLATDPAAAKDFLRSELNKKGFLTKEGDFINPDEAIKLLEGQPQGGLGFALERPFSSTKSGIEPKLLPDQPVKGAIEFDRKDILDINKKAKTNLQVPEEQLDLFERQPSKGKPTSPISMPEKTERSFLEGSKERINEFKVAENIKDVDPKNPLTSRVELNTKLGALESTATKQLKAGAEQSNLARRDALRVQGEFQKDFAIKPETLDSDVLFTYAESPSKAAAYQQLATTVGKEEADKVKAAAEYMKKTHDFYWAKVNEVRQQNGLAPIPYRENYVSHFHEFNVLEKLGLTDKVGTAEGAKIIEELGRPVTDNIYGRLKDVVFNHTKRQGDESIMDAAGSFNRYVNSAENYIKMQPYVNELNATAKTVQSKLPNLAGYIKDQADFIAGKQSAIDAGVEYIFSKPFLQGMYALQQNAVKNVVQGSPKVAMTQLFGELPTFATFPVRDFANGIMKQVLDPNLRAVAYNQSQVLKDRAFDLVERNLVAGPVSKQLNNLTSFFDYEVVNHAWITAYLNALRTGAPMQEAVAAAEKFAALSQSLTSPVNTPPMLRSKAIQSLIPLQNQQIAYARYLTQQMWKDKTLTQKGLIAAKAAISGSAIAALQQYMFGDRGESPLNPTNWVPLGGVLQRGMGGPVLSSAGDFVNAKTQEGKIRALIRAAFLIQKPIPAGAQVGRFVEKAVMGEKERGR